MRKIILLFILLCGGLLNAQISLSEIQDTVGKGYVPITDYDPALATYIQKYMLLQDYLEDSISWASVPVGLHDAVTLAGSYDYITLSGQVITRNQIDLTTDVTGLLPYASLSGAPTLLSQFTDDLGHIEESTTVTDLANGLDISLSTYDITVSPDFVELATETTIDNTDYVIIHDATTPNDGKITYANLLADIVSDASLDLEQVLTNGNDAGGLDALNFAEVEADEFIGDLRGAVLFKAQAGETLAKGDVVYVSGISGNTTIVSKADADDAAKMPAFGVVAAAASSPNPVDIYTFGTLSNLNTSAYTLGDVLYVSTTAGQLTATPPTGESALLQNIAKVTRVDNSAGSIKISGAGRTNATPNLNTGRLFVGNASNQAVADGTVYVDIANSRVGIETNAPSSTLDIIGDIQVSDLPNDNGATKMVAWGVDDRLKSTTLYTNSRIGVNGVGADLNDMTDYSSVSSADPDVNTPFGASWYNLINIRHRGGISDGYNYGGQIAFGMTNYRDRIAFRAHYNGTWDSWKELYHTDNITDVDVSTLDLTNYWQKSGSDLYYNTGNIGIGVTPSSKLDVVGEFQLDNATNGTNRVLIDSDGSGNTEFVDLSTLSGGTDDQTLSEVLSQGQDGGGLSLVNTPSIRPAITATTNLSIGEASYEWRIINERFTNYKAWIRAGIEIARITNRGLGIGKTPFYDLDVNGTANVTGFRMTTGAAVNRVLISDGVGLSSWADLSSLTGGTDDQTLSEVLTEGSNGGNLPITNVDYLSIGNTGTTKALQINAGGNDRDGILLYDHDVNNASPYLEIRGKRLDNNQSQSFAGGVALSRLHTTTYVGTNQNLGSIYFGGNHTNNSESNLLYTASIGAEADGNFTSATAMSTRLVFRTGEVGRALETPNVDYGFDRMYIYGDGDVRINQNLGIGINAAQKLQVAGNIYTADNGVQNSIRAYSSAGDFSELDGTGIRTSRSTAYIRPQGDGTENIGIGQTGFQYNAILNNYSNRTDFSLNSNIVMRVTDYLRIYDSSQNIDIQLNPNGDSYIMNDLGIGTTSPSYRLHVTDDLADTSSGASLIASRITTTTSNPVNVDIRTIRNAAGSTWNDTETRLEYNVGDNNSKRMWMAFISDGNGTTNNKISFGEGLSTEWMRIDNGNVAIGTTTPQAKLEINDTAPTLRVQRSDVNRYSILTDSTLSFTNEFAQVPISIDATTNTLQSLNSALTYNILTATAEVDYLFGHDGVFTIDPIAGTDNWHITTIDSEQFHAQGETDYYTLKYTDADGGFPTSKEWRFYDSGKVRINATDANWYDLPATDGTANQILQTNGNGVLSFVDNTSTDNQGLTWVDGTNTMQISGGTDAVITGFADATHTHTESEITDLDHYDLATLLTEDGSGSGLDADLLDGQSGAYYLDNTDDQTLAEVVAQGNSSNGAVNINVSPTTLGVSSLRIGANFSGSGGQTSLTNNFNKVGTVSIPHYNNSEKPTIAFFGNSTSTGNAVLIGGGTSYFNSATDIKFYTATNNTTLSGTERMSINNDGDINVDSNTLFVDANTNRVGIGTNSPSHELEVNGDVLIQDYMRIGGTGTDNDILMGVVGFTNILSANYYPFKIDLTTASEDFIIETGGTSNIQAVTVDGATGNVGLTQPNPSAKLDVVGTTELNGTVSVSQKIEHIGDTDTYMSFTGDDIQFVVGGSELLRMDEEATNGLISFNQSAADINFKIKGDNEQNLFVTDAFNDRIGMGVDSPAENLHLYRNSNTVNRFLIHSASTGDTSQADLQLNSGGYAWNTFVRYNDGNYLQFYSVTGGDVMVLESTGEVGIGTIDPSAELDVVGDTELNGILSVDGDVLYVDPSLDRVGINQLSPSAALDVVGTTELNGTTDVNGTTNLNGNLNVDTDVLTVNATTDEIRLNSPSVIVGGVDNLEFVDQVGYNEIEIHSSRLIISDDAGADIINIIESSHDLTWSDKAIAELYVTDDNISTSDYTQISFSTITQNTGTSISPSTVTNDIDITNAGKYEVRVTAQTYTTGDSTTECELALFVNDTEAASSGYRFPAGSGFTNILYGSAIPFTLTSTVTDDFSVNDEFEIRFRRNAGTGTCHCEDIRLYVERISWVD